MPLLAYPSNEAPNYKTGYKVNAGLWAVYLLGVPVILWFSKKYPVAQIPAEEEFQQEIDEKDIDPKNTVNHSITTSIEV